MSLAFCRGLGWEDPLEKEMATHSSILAWKIPWMEMPGRLQSVALGSSLRSPAEGEGHEGFTPPPEKDLESPSSTRQLLQLEEG